MGNTHPPLPPLPSERSYRPAPLGRAQFHVERFADDLARSFGGPPLAKARRERLNRHRVGHLRDDGGRGSFEVSLVDDAGEPTGYIARVMVCYSRFDADATKGGQ